MKNTTRFWFLRNFGNARGGIDYESAAKFCCVRPRTVRHWWSTSCPAWVDKLAELADRAVPSTKEWRGFRFSPDGKKLLTPYANHSFTPSELIRLFYDQQFSALTRVERDKLVEQLDAVRSEAEAEAICDELNYLIRSIEKLKLSPILAKAGSFSKAIKKRD